MRSKSDQTLKKCMFCNDRCSGAKRAKEHIFPQHLLREFSLQKEKLDHSQFRIVKSDFSGGHISIVPKERSLTYSGFLAGQVCSVCNSGWMSNLEIAVQPFLYKLIRGEMTIESLSTESRSTLACWSYKTSIVLSQSIGAYQFLIPLDHAKLFHQNRGKSLPDQVSVFSYSCTSSDYLWSLCPTWIIETSENIKREEVMHDYNTSYKVFLQMGNLMLISCHWSRKGAFYSYENWGAVPIGNPEICHIASRDCRESMDTESDQFMMSIGAYVA
jgi:hypothetical protein